MSTGVLRRTAVALSALFVVAGLVGTAAADSGDRRSTSHHGGSRGRSFQVASTLDVMAANGSAVAEIVDANADGTVLAYTDAGNEEIGFVDISDPAHPVGTGTLAMPGEPTSLVIRGGLVLVGVNTSASFVDPSGQLVVVDIATRTIVATHDVGGQPDSLALSPSGKHLAIVIENERDEDLNDGLLPQLPSGGLAHVVLRGAPASWTVDPVDLSKVAAPAADGDDLEPEFVDINGKDQAVVTFQENNHLAVIDLRKGKVLRSFPAGSATVEGVDTVEDDLLSYDSTITRRREPDAVAWIGNHAFATANEGDYTDADGVEGGSRGFTVFDTAGNVRHESGSSFEHLLASAGHYPEARSENKGVEPEAVEYGRYGSTDYLFVGSERGNAVGVYEMKGKTPKFRQLLPTGIGPEGVKAVPKRGLLVTSTETDVADAGIPTMITIYRLEKGAPSYPSIRSVDAADGTPIPWTALSGLAADPAKASRLYAVSDAFLAEGYLHEVRTDRTPAEIVGRTQISGASAPLDLEAVAIAPSGSTWLGSEGDGDEVPNLVLEVDRTTGAVLREFALPAALADNARSNGIEGIAVTGEPGAEIVHVAIQRAWPATGDVDGEVAKIGRLDTATGRWTFALYPLEPVGAGDWIGLSEITPLPDGTFAVIERDKGWGPSTGPVAELKAVFGVDLAAEQFRDLGDPRGLTTVRKGLLRDLLPDLADGSVWTPEKVEGLAVAADGKVYAVTDNDGVDDATGETMFLRLGSWKKAFAPLDLPEPSEYSLTVLHFNDGESDLLGEEGTGAGSISRFGWLLDQFQTYDEAGPQQGQVTVSAGDNFLAGPELTAGVDNGTLYDAIALEHLDIDAFTIGNHEFDFGPDFLADFIQDFDDDDDVFISSNLDVSAVPSLAALEAAGRIAPSRVVEEDGHRIGIIGATTPELPAVSSPGDVVVDEDLAGRIQAQVDLMTAAGIDKILVSSHLQDISNEQALAAELRDVDAIIGGGGGEDLAASYPLSATDLDGATVPIVTVPGDYFDIGRLTLTFDAAGHVTSFGGQLVPVSGELPQDPFLVTNVEQPVEAFLASLDATVVATTDVGVNGVRADVRTRETNLGNLMADALLAAATDRAAAYGVPTPLVALQNGGGIRNDSVIPPGDLTLLDTFDIAPFGNFVSVMPDVSREDLVAAIEHGLSGLPGAAGSFGHWSGLTVTYDPAAPAGARVVDVTLDDGTPIAVAGVVQPGPGIPLATSSFLAGGQDGYTMFEGDPFTTVGITDQQALAARLGALGTFTAPDPVAIADRTRLIPQS